MPGILSRYLGRTILVWVVVVGVLLVGLYSIINGAREARDLTGDYGALQMLVYMAQTTPGRLYDIFPFAALLGTMLGLGGLAGSNELVAMRAIGYDRSRILGGVLLTTGACLAVLVVFAEFVIPELDARANAQRDQLRSGHVRLGKFGSLWLRDGSMMVRVGHSAWSSKDQPEFADVLIYRIADDMQPEEIMHADRASHTGSEWLLENVVRRSTFGDFSATRKDHVAVDSTLGYDLLSSVVSKPRLMAIGDLKRMIHLLEANKLDADRYRQALWNRVFFPLNVLAMILVSMPFAFRGGRQGSRGLSIFMGLSLGLMFFVISRLVRGLAPLWPGPLWLMMLAPSVFFGLVGLALVRRL